VPQLTREAAVALDEASPLRDRRELFAIPEGTVYLTGNSLGAIPKHVPERMAEVVAQEWGEALISAWNTADWTQLPWRVAAKIEPMIGAARGTVHVGDSTSVTLFKTMVAATNLRPDRDVIVIEPTTFPTDGYIAQGIARSFGKTVRWCDPSDPVASLDDDVALLSLTHVDFRSGAMFDMGGVTAAAHEAGAVMLWDLCHSVGAVPVDLAMADADFAVGCTYKYLNGGPGAPAFGYVAPRLHDSIEQPITGWWGHARPFEMLRDYEPARGVAQLTVGTPPVLALSALEAALEAFEGLSKEDVRSSSLSLTDLFIELVEARLPGAFELITPREHARRGSQVSWRHGHAYGIVQALIKRGVVGDFREPDVARFGFAPLYVTHADVYDAVEQLVQVLAADEHLDAAYAVKNPVT
jgi:kynureninase